MLTCPQLYKNLDLRSLEVHELYKLTSVFGAWKECTAKMKWLQQRSKLVEKLRRTHLLQAHLYNWRYQLYLSGKEQKVVGPRNEQR